MNKPKQLPPPPIFCPNPFRLVSRKPSPDDPSCTRTGMVPFSYLDHVRSTYFAVQRVRPPFQTRARPECRNCKQRSVCCIDDSTLTFSGNVSLLDRLLQSESLRPTPYKCWQSPGPPSIDLEARLNDYKNNTSNRGFHCALIRPISLLLLAKEHISPNASLPHYFKRPLTTHFLLRLIIKRL